MHRLFSSQTFPVTLLCATILLSSCEKDISPPVLNVTTRANSESSYLVSEDEARAAAENIASSYEIWGQYREYSAEGGQDTQRVFWGRQQIESFLAVKSEDGLPAFYISNYAGGGFSLIAADRHMQPVLAYSEYGSFPLEGLQDYNAVPDGLITWMETTKAAAVAFRKYPEPENTAPGAEEAWRQITYPCDMGPAMPRSTSGGSFPLESPTPCPPPVTTTVTRGPLVPSNWGQGQGTVFSSRTYNLYCPPSPNWFYRYHSPTGCLATAMAQIMYRWNRPASYQWGLMLPNSATNETAQLMYDAGVSVNTVYGDNSSSARTYNAIRALHTNFGYNMARWLTYSGNGTAYSTVTDNITAGMPVIIEGNSAQSSDLFSSWPSGVGHAWVCDGYQRVTIPIRGSNTWVSYLSFHMNWGWDGTANGLFRFDDWTIRVSGQPDISFPYFNSAIIDIRP